MRAEGLSVGDMDGHRHLEEGDERWCGLNLTGTGNSLGLLQLVRALDLMLATTSSLVFNHLRALPRARRPKCHSR